MPLPKLLVPTSTPRPESCKAAAANAPRPAKPAAARPVAAERPTEASRLSYRDQREREQLPANMARLGEEIARLEMQLADPALYAKALAVAAPVTTAAFPHGLPSLNRN